MTESTRFSRLLCWLHRVEDSFLVVLLSTMIALAVTQIILRNVFDSGLDWVGPALRLLVLWVGLAGAMLATREDHHISIDIVMRHLPARLQRPIRVFIDLFTGIVSAVIAYHGGRLAAMDRDDGTIAFAQIPTWWCELIIPLAFGVIALRYLINTWGHASQFLRGMPE